jgi:hypothetical protein
MRAWGIPCILGETGREEESLTGLNNLKCGVFVSGSSEKAVKRLNTGGARVYLWLF